MAAFLPWEWATSHLEKFGGAQAIPDDVMLNYWMRMASGAFGIVGLFFLLAAWSPYKIIPAFPEIYNPATGKWKKLSGARNAEYFNGNWYYPRAFLKDDGKVVVLDRKKGKVLELSVNGTGSFKQIGTLPLGYVAPNLPTVMFQPGKILTMNQAGKAIVLDVQGSNVTSTVVNSTGNPRIWPDATILANGEVFLSGGRRGGGKTPEEQLSRSVYKGQIWNPDTGVWTDTAVAKKARLYHSTAILLPDARVVIAGGGPPGPVVNMNAERYLPPYLFNPDGTPATRPGIDTVGDVQYGDRFNLVLKENESISKVSFIRAGSSTHSFDQGQRYMALEFSQEGSILNIAAPENSNIAPPGLYMLFVLNAEGVPSVAKLIMM